MAKFLDLDAIAAEADEFIIKLGGIEHKLMPTSVEDFVINTKAVQALSAGVRDIAEEVELMIGMIVRSFPSMNSADLKKLPIAALNRIVDFARQHGGEKTEAPADAAANPQTAPASSAPSTSDSSSAG